MSNQSPRFYVQILPLPPTESTALNTYLHCLHLNPALLSMIPDYSTIMCQDVFKVLCR